MPPVADAGKDTAARSRIGGFHLNALSSGIPLNVALDTTVTVLADTLWRHFLDTGGQLHITENSVTCALNLRSHHPVLIDAGLADL